MANILVLTSRFPFPLEKGDKLRIYNQIVCLSKTNKIHLIAINHALITKEQENELTPFCDKIDVFVIPAYARIFSLFRSFFTGIPFQVGLFYQRKIHARIRRIIDIEKPAAIYCHLIRMSEYVKDVHGIRKTLDYMDVYSKGMKRRLDTTTNVFKKFVFHVEYRRLLKYEFAVFDRFDAHVIISDQDRKAIPHPDRNKIAIIPNGVDFSIFYPMQQEKKYELLFSGNMGYPPNIDAAYYAATEVLPLLLKKNPSIRLLIAGIDPPEKLKKLQSKNIAVVEHFDHIRDAFAQATVNLSPMITSIGLQNKILQAMAMNLPNVTTPAGARGINAENEEVVLIGNTAEELAAHVEGLLNNTEKREQLSAKALTYVRANFSWAEFNDQLQQLILV